MTVIGGLFSALSTSAVLSQTPATPAGTTNALFAPLTLAPAPNEMRLANGAPGPKYWQNRADYDMKVTFDPIAGVLRGAIVLRYINNSPHTLDFIWVQTPWESIASDTILPPVSKDTTPWQARQGRIKTFNQLLSNKPVPLTLEEQPGFVKALLAQPLTPGQTATFEVTWVLNMSKSSLYQFVNWYPSVAIYDDVRGWHHVRASDFDFGDFTVEVTLPSTYIVAGMGTLENPTEVLPAPIARKLAQAVTADTIVHIITHAELKAGTSRLKEAGMLTWKFRAKNVNDVAWATAEDYLWNGTGWRGILIQTFHRAWSPPVWERSTEIARQAIQVHSEHWGMYAYPQFTLADALDPGLAFSMGASVNTMIAAMVVEVSDPPDTNIFFPTIVHEAAHQWFPLMVGSSEGAYPWMSEGFATFLQGEVRGYPTEQRLEPIDGPEGNVTNPDIYYAPAAMLTVLRQYILGPQLFDTAMRTYVRRWSFKHPTPIDFFRTMEDVSQRKLDWFWREWVYMPQPYTYDLSIDSVTQTRQGNDTRISVVYRNNGTGVLPIIAKLTYSDSTSETLIQPAESWQASPVQTVVYRAQGKTLKKVEIDASHGLPDMNQANNVWVQPEQP